MKKFFSFLLFVPLFFASNAQIVITSTDMPTAGTYITQTSDTTPSAALPVFDTGANTSWDFTGLNNQAPSAFGFVDPSTTPYISYFPSATHCYMTADSMFGYIYANSSYVVALGARVMMDTLEIIMQYDPDDTLYVFPYTYGTTYESHPVGAVKMFYGDSVNFGMGNVYIDSIRMTMSYDKNTVVDGWGNVTTPLGTYPTLRSSRVEIMEQEIAVHYMSMWIPINTTIDTSLVIEWSMKNTGIPLISITADPADSTYQSVDWLTVSPSFGFNETSSMNGINVYPNPANDQISISFDGETPEMVIVSDICGREVKRINTNAEAGIHIDITDLSSGVYFISAASKGRIYATGRFIKQ